MAHLRCMMALVAGMTLVLAGHLPASAQSSGLEGAVQHGNCDHVADSVSDLTPPLLATGEHRGSSDAIPATSSFSTIPIALDTLLADDHVVTISDPEGDVVACGEVGGRRTDAGALIIGLSAEDESAITGIAYFAPSGDPAQTDVSLFVAGDPLAEMAAPVEVVAQEVPEAVIEAEDVDALLTPLPAAEQATGFSAEELAYSDDVVEITGSILESFEDFSALMENPQFGDAFWTIEVATQFAIWDENYEDAQALSPPPVFAETHRLFVDALRLYSEAGHDFALGMDTLDMAMINEGVSKVNQAAELIDQATADVKRVQQERGN